MDRPLWTPEIARTPEYDIPEVLVLDFDRMLGDVDMCMDHLYVAAEKYGVDATPIREARNKTEGRKTFEPITYIQERLSAEDYEKFSYDFVNFHRFVPMENGGQAARFESVLYPDAQRFLQRLAHADIPHVIMTFGENEEWQRLKLMAAGYPMGCTVTDTPDKGAALQSLRGEDGNFHMYVARHGQAIYHAPRLTFIDDKAMAFANVPDDEAYAGFWLQRGTLLPHQMGDVKGNVTPIRSLDELQVTEDGRTYVGELPETEPFPSKAGRWRGNNRLDIFSSVHSRYAVYLPLHPGVEVRTHPDGTPDFIANAPVVQFDSGKRAA